jgi:hypothetical protein
MLLLVLSVFVLFLLAAILDRRQKTKRDPRVESWDEFARSHDL